MLESAKHHRQALCHASITRPFYKSASLHDDHSLSSPSEAGITLFADGNAIDFTASECIMYTAWSILKLWLAPKTRQEAVLEFQVGLLNTFLLLTCQAFQVKATTS